MSRGFFFFFTITTSSCISKLWTACSQSAFTIMSWKSQELRPPHGVYCRSPLGPWPSVTPWQTGEGFHPRGAWVTVLLWRFRYSVLQQKPNWLPYADLKITSAQIVRAECNLNCTYNVINCVSDRHDDISLLPYTGEARLFFFFINHISVLQKRRSHGQIIMLPSHR